MKAFRNFLLLLLALAVFGCTAPINPHRPHRPNTPDVQPDEPEEFDRPALFSELAKQIDAKNIDTTEELRRVIAILSDAKAWTDADSEAIERLLPDVANADRALTSADAAKLRETK